VKESFMNADEQNSATLYTKERDFVVGPHIHSSLPANKTDAARETMFPQSVELHIEELLLHGFEPGDRYRISDAVEHELARLFADRGVPPSLAGGDGAAMLDVGEFTVAQGTTPEEIGAQVAHAIYGGLNK
jgi:hypothetical protein